jgi:hypothetical protein
VNAAVHQFASYAGEADRELLSTLRQLEFSAVIGYIHGA